MNQGVDTIDKINLRLGALREYLKILKSLKDIIKEELIEDKVGERLWPTLALSWQKKRF